MGPAAILSVLVDAQTQGATARLSEFDAKFRSVSDVARKGIEARLGATVNSAGIDEYQRKLAQVQRRAAERSAFKAELGANFNNSAFNAWFRENEKVRREAELTHQTLSQQMHSAAGSFFTGSRGASGEQRSFARGTLRGTVGRGAGFIGSGLAGGLLGYVSARGIESSISSTTQMVKQAEILSRYTGMSAKSALELEAVSNALGSSSRKLGMGFRTLATQVNSALVKPTAANTEAFRALGLSQAQVKAQSKDLGGMFGLIADKLNQLPPGAEKTAIAAKLLGRNWQQLAPLIEQGSKGMKEQMDQAQALGVTLGGSPLQNIEKLHDAQIKLKLAQEGLSVQFTEHLAPALISMMTGAIKLAGTVRRDLSPAFHDLSPIVKDVGHWLAQNKGIVEDLVIAFAGLKIIRTVGGWMGGLYNDAKKVVTVGGGLIGLFKGQQTETQQLTVAMNELAASMERVSVAQRGVTGSTAGADAAIGTETAAAGAGTGTLLGRAGAFAAGRLVPAAALAYMVYQGMTYGKNGVKNQGPGGLASLLGPTSAWTFGTVDTPGMHMSQNAGDLLQSFNPFGGHPLGAVKFVQNQNGASKMLAQLRTGLKNVSDASQLTTGQLNHYYGIVQKLLSQPDLTAKQRKGLAQLAQQLNPVMNALKRTEAVWANSFAGIDVTTAHAMRQVINTVQSSIHTLETNAPRGTRRWTNQMTGLIAAAWQKIETLSAEGVSGVGGAIASLNHLVTQELHKLGTMIPPGLLKGAESGGVAGIVSLLSWAASQNSASKQGVSTQSAQGIAGRGVHLNVAGSAAGRHAAASAPWNIPAAHHAAAHAAARHMEYNPFTGRYELMTSAQHSLLRDRYIIQNGVAPPSSPHAASHSTTSTSAGARHARTLAVQQARHNQQLIQKSLGYQSAGGAGNTVQVPSQSAGMQIEFQQIANALQQAQNSNNITAQDRLLNRQVRLDRRAIGLDQAKLRGIVRQLHGALSKARRSQLMQDKLQLLQDMGTLRNDIGSAMSQLQNIAGGGSSGGAFDLAPSGANIKTPTIYDVRTGARAERHKLEQHNHHSTNTINIHVRHEGDVPKVADALDRALGSHVHARMRAAGMRGT